jgi:demethylmenaquinone methyltransferase/2-methoxy-6-polyprenyl-1,4-benzoquinol methylase
MVDRKSAVREQFDKDAHHYLSKHLTPEKIRERDRILAMINHDKRYQRILDLGCGPGTISMDLLGISNEVWGIDISGDMIRIASERCRGTEAGARMFFGVGDAENLNFPDNFFDAVVCLGVLRYLGSLEKGLKEIRRVLRPGGVIVGTFYQRYSLYWLSMYLLYRPFLPLISILKRRTAGELIKKYKAEPLPFSYKKFRRVFAEAGFIHSETLHSGLNIFPLNRIFPALSREVYLKTESLFHHSGSLGWLGSVCIVKGFRQ